MKEKNAACCEASFTPENTSPGDAVGMKASGAHVTVSLLIRGMTCLSCARRIEGALSECPGVVEAEVDFVLRKVTVRFDSSKVSQDELKRAVDSAGYQVSEREQEDLKETADLSLSDLLSRPRPYLIGAAAAAGVIGFYLGLLTLTSDWHNAKAEFMEYGVWIIVLATGLGVQVALFSMLRGWHRGGSMKTAKCTLAASGGMSTTAMAACCSHYLSVFLPALGLPFLSSAAASLADYQIYFFFAGVFSNLFGIGLMLRMMRRNGIIQAWAFASRLSLGFVRIRS